MNERPGRGLFRTDVPAFSMVNRNPANRVAGEPGMIEPASNNNSQVVVVAPSSGDKPLHVRPPQGAPAC